MIEQETGKVLNCLQTDNGGEYMSNDIRHEKIVPSIPQYKGVPERMNHALLSKRSEAC